MSQTLLDSRTTPCSQLKTSVAFICFRCKACGKAFKVQSTSAGKQAKCICGEHLIVPTHYVQDSDDSRAESNSKDDPTDRDSRYAKRRLKGPSLGLILLALVSLLFFGTSILSLPPSVALLVLVNLFTSLIILIGALQMRNLKSYSLALGTAILSTIPFCSPMVWLGIPFGIWSLVVLADRDVRGSFESW